MDGNQNGHGDHVEDTVNDLLDKIRHRKPSEVRSYIRELPNHIFKKIFPKEDEVEMIPDEKVEAFDDEELKPACGGISELLPAACKNGDLDTVKLLLFHEINPSWKGKEGSPLEVATFYNRRDVIDVLLKCKADLATDIAQVKRCLAEACRGSHEELVTFWLERLKKASGRKLSSADFVAENDPVIAACKGDHPDQVANQLLTEEVFFINGETVSHAGDKLALCLEAWVDEDYEESSAEKKALVARWSNKHLHTFSPAWLGLSKYEDTLTCVDLSYNSLTTIPGLLLWGLPWLRKLILSNNKIDRLPTLGNSQQLQKSSLQFLTLASNKLKTVPSEIFMFSSLETLSLAQNQIDKIELANIEFRIASQNSMEPAWRCSSLKQLDLSSNRLQSIPDGIHAATQLTKLYIASNRLTEIPQSWFCPLEKLNANDNLITFVPDIHVHWQKSLKFLDLSKNKLTAIPLPICWLSGLIDLNLSKNQIQKLPEPKEWCSLRLSILDLSHNELFHGELDQFLESDVDISSNAGSIRSAFTRTVKKLSGDRNSDMGVNSTDPNTVFYVNLDKSKDEDQLQLEFPKVFASCLCTLNLGHNNLQSLPDAICEMKTLQVLDLQGNPDLTNLPGRLSTLKNLYSIKVDQNQIKDPPEIDRILSNGIKPSQSIKRVLREKLHDSQPYRCVKLMIVGSKKSGKTSLMTQLLNCDWPMEDRGVNVKNWPLLNVAAQSSSLRRLTSPSLSQAYQESEINVALWDLKGGENYALVHQTLFTPRTLYLVVWDVSEKESGIEKLRPWLLNIRSRAPQSCVIAVGTHTDLLPKNKVRQGIINSLTEKLHQAYPEVAECLVIDTGAHQPGIGIENLKKTIYHRASNMKYYEVHPIKEDGLLVGRKVPRSYIVLKDLLRINLTHMNTSNPVKPPIMTEAELTHHFHTIPGSHLEKSEEADAAVRFLRDTGSLTHVNDHTYQLTNLYFLDPSWLCDVLLAVVEYQHQSSYIQDGMVLKRDLKKLCIESGFGENRFEEYLQLLGRFEIAFAATAHRCLIPSLLPRRPPVIRQTHARVFHHKIQRLYKMAYIPPGFWSRLVSRLMVSIKQMEEEDDGVLQRLSTVKRFSQDIRSLWESDQDDSTITMIWQEGMSLNYDLGQFTIEPMNFPDEHQGIRIIVRSYSNDFAMLGFIVDHIESLFTEWYPGLEESDDMIERLVPCPVCEDRITEKEGPYGSIDIFTACNVFAFNDLAVAATLRYQEHVPCDRHPDKHVLLETVVPDMFLSDLSVPHLDESKLILGKKLGEGGFGEVFKAAYQGTHVAVKRFMKKRPTDRVKTIYTDAAITDEEVVAVKNTFPDLRSELAIMSQLDHPCILKAVGVSIHQLCFAMEFAPLGDLASYIREQYVSTRPIMLTEKVLHESILPRMLTYKICLQITAAIAYIHHRRVIHTDLKTDNILLFSTDITDRVNVKLADYGISRNLVAGGVRGRAGFHAFCAPEIVKGKAFDEKADLFSLGMLFYHIISGLIPFDDESSIETKVNITTGTRPKFEHIEYAMLPRCAHLEALMKACWQDSPIDRPSARNSLNIMQNANFLCLRHYLEVESESEACLYTQDTATAQDERAKCDLWLWRKSEDERIVTTFNFEYNTADHETKEWPGDKVLCAVQFGEYHVLGTRSEKLEIYKFNREERRLTHQTDLFVLTQKPATSLFYYHMDGKTKSDDLLGYLFAGLEDGTLLIYSHYTPQMSNENVSKTWELRKRLVLSGDPKPCQCMVLVNHRHELLIGCGNKVRVLNLNDLLLDQQVLDVECVDDQMVQGITCYGDMAWCFTEGSTHIAQFDLSKRNLVDRFYCSSTIVMRGHCLSDPIRNSTNMTGRLPVSPPSTIGDPPFRARRNVLSTRRNSFTAAVARRARFVTTRSIKSRSMGDSSVNYNVTSIITVKDTLWVGRSDGVILVVGIDKASDRYKFGEVLSVLHPSPMLDLQHGPVSRLFLVGSNRVIACRDIVPGEDPINEVRKISGSSSTSLRTGQTQVLSLKQRPYKHQLLVWEDWGSEELRQFEKAYEVCNYY